MPVYEFFCRKCEKSFLETMHVEEHDARLPECPQCHSAAEVEKRMSSFTAVTERKSSRY